MTRLKSATLASAAALLALSSMAVATPSFAKDEKVHCFGVNRCKGQSDCPANRPATSGACARRRSPVAHPLS